MFINPGIYKIEYYELGSDTPTRTRNISQGGGGSGGGNCNSDDWKLPINFDNCNIFDGVGGASVELSLIQKIQLTTLPKLLIVGVIGNL